MQDLAIPVSANLLCDLLNIPSDAWPRIEACIEDQSRFYIGDVGFETNEAVARKAETSASDFAAEFSTWGRGPIEDGRGALLRELQALGRYQSDRNQIELAGVCLNVITAGHWPMISAITAVLHVLLSSPDCQALQAAERISDPNLIDEALRCATPARTVGRIATCAARLGSEPIAAGDLTIVSLAALNADPVRFPNPDLLNPTRRHINHASFGLGMHYCLGARLARVILQEVIAGLCDLHPYLSLAADAQELPTTGGLCLVSRLPLVSERGTHGE
ncbi:cytochrome P450 [Falsiruegeria litorea]|uniref:cytochrome P450 n=1 Tax=Falsiruegeria litorea TaxID=1280831 RepID=UPI0013FDCACB|nr:cytochrome P450 [Falsiruegeria litorea]